MLTPVYQPTLPKENANAKSKTFFSKFSYSCSFLLLKKTCYVVVMKFYKYFMLEASDIYEQ